MVAQWNNYLAWNIFFGAPRDHLLIVKNLRDSTCMSDSRAPNYFVLGGTG
jgi:hypothetical protein